MFRFQPIFTWHSLVVHVLLLSMIAAAFALPIQSKENTIATAPPRAKPSKDHSTPIEFIIIVIIENGKAEWTEQHEVDPLARWVMALIPSEDLNRSRRQVWGYQTIRYKWETESETKWKMKVAEDRKRYLYGALATLSDKHLLLKIGAVSMSLTTQYTLTTRMRAELHEYRSDELPNVPSIYQFLLLFHKVALEDSHTKVHRFDISESSEFGKAFKQMVRKKGTGATPGGVMSQWEWELYERIQSGAIILEDSLWKHRNKDILVNLRADALKVPSVFFESQDIEDDLHHPALAGPSPGHN
ncbi:hypothetical protein F5878DRAFT_617004 [Lentinula raphanica]|uniref:Uncharacterized protein n=1 Tax=Lentinula raphanica TaxID=153919 RepID=A0AA38PAB4_9AGAR|nr:hypothetical protein F5878DRAFT_617004 [Lentinula raphanica]